MRRAWCLLAAGAWLAAPVGGGAGARRIAPMVTVESRAGGGPALSDPRVEDRQDREGRVVVAGFLFRLDGASDPPAPREAELQVEPPSGPARSYHASAAEGGELRFDVRIPVTARTEGEWRARVTLSGADGRPASSGLYTFGYPRYEESRDFRRVATSSPIRDDFNGTSLNQSLWRVWSSDPDRARVHLEGGRLTIEARGQVGYNGLVSRVDMDTRDVEMVCRVGVRSEPGARHTALAHLCGSGPLSPDHWIEVQLRDMGEGRAAATVNVAVPPGQRQGYRGLYELPASGETGHLLRITCEAGDNVCRGFAWVPFESGRGGEWWQLGDGFEVPARSSRLEIKTAGWAEPGASSRIWFDDCRMYPRARTHYLTVVLKRPDGRPPGGAAGSEPDPICFDAANARLDGCDLSVELLDGEGKRLIDEAKAGVGFGYAMLKLADSGWDLYPVSAVLRVSANGRPIGPDHVIRGGAVDGLYPDDVYSITLY